MDKCSTCNSIIEPESKRKCPVTEHDICPNCWTFVDNVGYVLSEKGLVMIATSKIKIAQIQLEKMCLDELLSMDDQVKRTQIQVSETIAKHTDDMYNRYLDICIAQGKIA